mgnify:CR=1 FL=1
MKIRIEKYADGVVQETFTLPLGPLRFLAGLLPAEASRKLSNHGLDLEKLLDANTDDDGVQWLEVTEKDTPKRIRISRVQ